MKNPDPFGCSPMSMRTEALVNSSETPPGIDLCFRRGRWRGTGRLVALPEQPHLEGRVGRPLDQEGRQLTALDTYVDAELDLGLFGCDFHDGTGHRVRDSADRATYVIECERLISAATEDTVPNDSAFAIREAIGICSTGRRGVSRSKSRSRAAASALCAPIGGVKRTAARNSLMPDMH